MRLVFFLVLAGCSCTDGTVAPPGADPSRYDAVASVAEVGRFVGPGAELVDMECRGVREDGTIDLNQTWGSCEYDFVRQLAEPPADAPPVGAGGSPDGRWFVATRVNVYQPGQWRHVTTGSSEYDYQHQGMEKSDGTPSGTPSGEAIPAPACKFADLWAIAKQNGAPSGAVADIDYDKDGYEFDIRDAGVDLDFGTDCAVKGGF